MDPSSGQHQEMPLENMLVCSKAHQERKARPQPEQAQKCPRCDSTNTKFCYYNNYSLSQPRYFCKSCRRYWTKGGTLRNVPVGGGCRKNKRSSSSTSSFKRSQDQQLTSSALPQLTYDSNDLTLAFARLQKQSSLLGFDHEHDHFSLLGNHSNTHCDIFGNLESAHTSPSAPAFVHAFRSGFLDTQNGNFQNFYYDCGNGGNNVGDLENNICAGGGGGGEMVLPYHDHHDTMSTTGGTTQAVTVTTMKQELCNGREEESKVMLGFPWQINGNGNMNEANFGRESWNGLSYTWHGLINSPLM